MEQLNKIVQTALIGTAKKPLELTDFETEFSTAFSTIHSNETIENEEKFLQSASLVFNYRQAGVTALNKEIENTIAEEETLLYCSDFAKQVLKDILFEDSNPLLKTWLLECANRNLLVHPEWLPTLFDKAIQQKQLRNLVETCGGKRGRWLSKFNSEWLFAVSILDDELWLTGTFEQRKNVLENVRTKEFSKAREWIQQTWQQENAATKQAFLEVLETNLSVDDAEWLETLSKDKSSKVKDEALRLLKLIPESTIIKKYKEILRESVILKKEKALFGLSSKTALHFNLISNIEEEIFKSGIEKLSPQKNISDEDYILQQLIAQVPPSFWEEHLQLSAKEIIDFLDKSDKGKVFIESLSLAIKKFKANNWAIHFMDREEKTYLVLIPLLPTELKEKYILKYFEKESVPLMNLVIKEQQEWSLVLTKKIFAFTAKNPYQYNRSFYNQHIQLIPVQASGILESCMPSEEYAKNSWAITVAYINKLLVLKQQVKQAFGE